ncbi:hypothetical protein [Neolewinella antarctica]|uniref:Uncharacterized protein n=1 Tax=Neolewinella antarctica TaxID=442734 RepID=A0ABX0XI09_9BACT|nr:hypothetical protein [Neolewinella antarctica]NJC28519.1 hypothetical protein [Neolewinella antarctica]
MPTLKFSFYLLCFLFSTSCFSQEGGKIYACPLKYQTLPGDYISKYISNYERADYEVIYVGKVSDTVSVLNSGNRIANLGSHAVNAYNEEVSYNTLNHSNIRLEIDTSSLLDIRTLDLKDRSESQVRVGVPIIVRNISDSTVRIGVGYNVPIHMMYKPIGQSKWKMFDSRPFVYSCGVGLHDIVLYQNEIGITFTLLHQEGTKSQIMFAIIDHSTDKLITTRPFYGLVNESLLDD